LIKYIAAGIDFKSHGNSDSDATLSYPDWFLNKNGIGAVIN